MNSHQRRKVRRAYDRLLDEVKDTPMPIPRYEPVNRTISIIKEKPEGWEPKEWVDEHVDYWCESCNNIWNFHQRRQAKVWYPLRLGHIVPCQDLMCYNNNVGNWKGLPDRNFD